ncbi:MAG: nucleotidyltransferase domain-containing protein [Acidimicrobiia bacterium]
MAASDPGPWAPLTLDEATDTFRGAPFRWWIAGGHALELYVGTAWREHADIDVGFMRSEAHAVREHLTGWDVHVATAGRLYAWDGSPLVAGAGQNNLWARRDAHAPWCLDLLVGDGDESAWRYRRDPVVRLPWRTALLMTNDGVPYLAPEVQLLFKSTSGRPKDAHDARNVIPALEPFRVAWLSGVLPTDHPWRARLQQR